MEPRKKTYLLTGGLVPLLENRHGLNLNDKTKEALRTIEHAYFAETHYLLQGRSDNDKEGVFFWDVQFIPDQEIERNLRTLITTNKTTRPLISFDDVYCKDLPDGFYSISRIINPNNIDEDPKLGPRMEHPALDKQVEEIRKKHGREIDIMDIGTFEGGTLCDEITGRFEQAGITVPKVYLTFAGKAGIDRLNTAGIEAKAIETFDWVDWLEIRDCLGFDGRKVQLTERELKDLRRRPDNLFVRYIERSEKWASIPESIKGRYEEMYHSFFNLIVRCLGNEGHQIRLNPLKSNSNVYALEIKGPRK